jgi:hypothetical protein
MRTTTAKLMIGVAITAIGMFGADNSIGTWKRNMDKSTSNPPESNPFKSQTMVREAVDGGVKVTVKGERMDGTVTDASTTIKYDGVAVPITGGTTFDSIAVKQIDDNTFTTEATKTGGSYHTMGRTVISKDGKTMTTTQKGTDANGKPISITTVYDKQ